METAPKEKPGSEQGTEAVTRAADVLLLFAGLSPSLGVSEIARQLKVSKAVVYRILRSLLSRHLLMYDERQRNYRLGPAIAALGARALRDLDLRQTALPTLRHLQQVTGETATVSMLIGATRVYLDQVPSLQEITMVVETGRSFPLHAGSSGKVMLAFAPPDLCQRILAGPFEALTARTKVTRAEIEADLQQIQRKGTAFSWGERQPGAASIAAPIFGYDRYVKGAISVCGPIDRFRTERVWQIEPLVKDAAKQISLQMGWDGLYPEHNV